MKKKFFFWKNKSLLYSLKGHSKFLRWFKLSLSNTNILWIMQSIKKLKFKSDIFKSSNKSIFYKFFYNFFFRYIKMSRNISAIHYQENKQKLHKKLITDINFFLRKKKKKKWQYGRDHYKNLSEDQNQKLLENRKKCYRMRKNVL